MRMEQRECSEMSAYKIQTPGNHPKESIQIKTGWNNLSGISCLECKDIFQHLLRVLNGAGVRLCAELAHRICSNILYHIIYCILDNSILQNSASQKFHNIHRTVRETCLFPRVNADIQRAMFWEQCSKAPVQGDWCSTHVYDELCTVIAYICYCLQRIQQPHY